MSGDGQVVVTYISKMGELLRDTAELNKQTAKTLGTLKEQGKEAENVGNIHTRMQAIAKRTFDETRTGAEKAAAKQAELNAAYKRGYIDVETYQRAVTQMTTGQQTGLASLFSGAQKAVGAVVGVGSALAAVSALAGVVRSEYDRFLERHKSAADYGKTESELKATLLNNAPIDMSGAEMDALISKTAAQAGGVDRLSIMRAMAPAISVSPNASREQVASFVGSSALLTGGSEQAMSGMARAGLGLADKQGWLNDPRKALGFLNAAQTQSMVFNPEQYAKSSAGVFSNAAINGFDIRETAATFGTMTRLGQDDQGSAASTATITMLTQLAKLRAPLGLPSNASQDEILRALNDPKNARHKAAFLGEGSKTVKGLHGEEKYIAGMQSFVEGGTAYSDYRAAVSKIPATDDAAAFYDARILQLGADESGYIAKQRRAGAASAEGYDADKRTQLAGTVMSQTDELLAKLPGHSPMDWLDRKRARAELQRQIESGVDPVAAAESSLGELADDYGLKGAGRSGSRMLLGVSESDAKAEADIRALIAALKENKAAYDKSTDEYKKAVDKFNSAKPVNGPRPAMQQGGSP